MTTDENGGCPEGQTADGLDAVQGIARTVPNDSAPRPRGATPDALDLDTPLLAKIRLADGGFREAHCYGAEAENGDPICDGEDVRAYWFLAPVDAASAVTGEPSWHATTWCADCKLAAEAQGYTVLPMHFLTRRSA